MKAKEKKLMYYKNSCSSYRSNIIEDVDGFTENTSTIMSNVKWN
jgi:hypothetical protein